MTPTVLLFVSIGISFRYSMVNGLIFFLVLCTWLRPDCFDRKMTERTIEIERDDIATVVVRSDYVVTLVFGRMSIEVFERDGRLFTCQGISDVENSQQVEVFSSGDDRDATLPLEDPSILIGTQPVDYQTPEDDTDEVVKFAGGTFREVNEKHESKLQLTEMRTEIDAIKEDLFKAGDTQIEGYDSDETELDDVLPMYTASMGLYIPSYLR